MEINYKEIDEVINKIGKKEIKKEEEIKNNFEDILLNNSIKLIEEEDSGLGKDFREISKELVSDNNVFRFGNTSKQQVGYLSVLAAVSDKPYYNKNIKPRYAFIQSFLYHYSINRSAIKSQQAERFKDLGSSLLAFKGALEYRAAGLNLGMEEEKKHSLLDKIRKG